MNQTDRYNRKRVMIRIFAMIILTAMMSSLWLLPVQASTFNTEVLDGVVFIEVYYTDNNGVLWLSSGTGFFVGESGKNPQYIITNAHVIINYALNKGADGDNTLTICYDKDDVEDGYLVDYNDDMDIAILKIGKATDKRKPLALEVFDETKQGQPVFAVGYPAIIEKATNAKSSYGKNDATVTSGIIGRFLMDAKSGRTDIQIDAAISGGNSGGPLVNPEGYVVGINTSTLSGAGYNFAVSIEEAIPLLHRNGVSYTLAPDPDEAVVETDEGSEEAEQVEEEEPSGLDLTLILLIAGGAVIVILVIFIVIILSAAKSKKKKPRTQRPAPAPANANVNAQAPVGAGGKTVGYSQMSVRGAVVKSLSTQHNGISVPAGKTPLTIGRDPAVCKIIFKDDTPGVSSKHCQIYFDSGNNCFVLTDLNSSYGTYLMNGQKLLPNTPIRLNAKDYFYLGSKDNTVFVDVI